MSIDVSVRFSPGWWLAHTARRLEQRRPRLERLWRYFSGDADLPESAENVRQAYARFQRKARTNFAELIVEALRERLNINGFTTAAAGDEAGDQEARRIWEASSMDVGAAQVHTHMFVFGVGYAMVGDPDDARQPLITAEDPRQVIAIPDPQRPRWVRAGLKIFYDEDFEQDVAFLFLPGGPDEPARVWRAVHARSTLDAAATAPRFEPQTWSWDPAYGGPDGLALPHPFVPIVPFVNRDGVGEFERHIDVLDRINHQVMQRMVIATMQAFRQRAAINLPEFDEDGKPIDYDQLLSPDPGALWLLPEGAELWESGQVDLTPILTACKDDITYLAAVTRTPLPVLMPGEATDSAEGAAFRREGLVFKAQDRITRASEGWRDTMSLAFLIAGDPDRADRSQLRVLWASPERRSLAERADANSKLQDIPFHTRMSEIMEFPPSVVERMVAEQLAEGLGTLTFDGAAGVSGPSDAAENAQTLKAQADALGALLRAGVLPEVAAQRAGLPDLRFVKDQASRLEDR